MTAVAVHTMTPDERADWEREMARVRPYMDPARYERHRERRSGLTVGGPVTQWPAEYANLWLASEQMALVLEGLLAGRVNRAQVSGALAAWHKTARTRAETED